MDSMAEMAMSITASAGDSKSYCMEAIQLAKAGDFEKAHEALEKASEGMAQAHEYQTDMIRRELNGNPVEISLLMVHAQDHVTMATLMRDIAAELVELYEKNKV